MADSNFVPNSSGASTFRGIDGGVAGVIQEVVRVSWGPNTAENLADDAAGKRLPVKVGEQLPAGTNNIGDVDVLTFPANTPFNVAQINGVAPLMGAGVTGTGSQRVTLATDGQGQLVDNAAFSDTVTRLDMAGFIFDETAGTALTENDAAAARIDSKRAVIMVLEDATTRGTRAAVTANGLAVQQATASALNAQVQGVAAQNAAVSGNPVLVGMEARTTGGTAVTAGNAARMIGDTLGKQIVLLGEAHDRHLNGRVNLTTTTASDVIAAQGAGVRIVVTGYSVTNAHATVNTKVELRDGTTVKIIDHAQSTGGGVARQGGSPIFISTANTAVTARAVTTGADVEVNVSGYSILN